MKTVYFVALLINLFYCSCALLVDDCRTNVVKEFKNAWKQLERIDREGKSSKELLTEVANLVRPIPEIISRVERELSVYEYEEALKSLSRAHNTSDEWKSRWSEIAILASPVDVLYGHFKLFPDMPETFAPGSKVMDFDVNTITDLILKPLYNTDEKGTITLAYLVEHIHNIVTSQRSPTTFELLNDFVDDALEKSNYCLWNGKTPQRILYGFYVMVRTLDIKEFTLKNFAWMMGNILNNTNSKVDAERAEAILQTRTSEKYASARSVISEASPAYWRCDPDKFVEGENYVQFRELLQGYIENEVRMHPSGSCKQTCSDFQFTKAKCNEPDDETCFRRRICTGNLVNCEYIAADAEVCLADPPRRFDYIHYKKGPHLGKEEKCSGVTERRDSYWRLFYHCSNCFCLCDDPKSPTTVRHVSLASVTSDVDSNKIVTGVRFHMKDGILHLEVEQGIPEKNGFILEGSAEWKSPPTLNKNDKTQVAVLDYTNRAIDLDDIVVPPEYVITGIRFRQLGSHMNLEVRATQINPLTGELLLGSSHWLSNDNTPEAQHQPRQELVLEDPAIPTLSKKPSIPDSVHDQYLNFGASSRASDASQTTVPFIDTQPVRPNPPVWLQGIGLYHKGQPGSGGFLAPRIFTKSASDFMHIPKE